MKESKWTLIILVLLLIVNYATLQTSLSKASSSNSVAQLWKFMTNGSVYSSPVVAGGYIYVESSYGYGLTATVYCIDASSGNQVWNYSLDWFYFTPVIDGSHVYVVSRIYTPSTQSDVTLLYALNATTGTKEWNYTSEYTLFPPVVIGGTVYIQSTSTPGSGEFIIHALDSSTGTEIWNYKSAGDKYFVVDNGYVFMGFGNSVYAIDAFTGKKLWNYTIDSHGALNVGVSDVVVGQLLYVGTDYTDFYALDPSSGAKVWNFTTEYPASSSVESGSFVYVRADMNIYALDASTGAIKWTSKFEDYGNGDPIVSNPYLFYSSEKKLYCLDSSTGERKWVYPTEGYAPFVVAGSRVYLGSAGPQFLASSAYHNFSVFDAFTGERLWNYTIEGYASSICVVGERVYVGSAFASTESQGQEGSGALYALEMPLVSSAQPTSLFSLQLIATVTVVAFVGIFLLIYFKKRKRKTSVQ